ncbi:MAG TPA: hypothetical protein VFX38_06515 [Gammaproteobacteria bacterium]|nr:hypothetical protein [Gammaproteobacteria bacterium]
MAIVDDLTRALTDALSAGADAARAQGAALKGDFETLVRPQLEDIAAQAAQIAEDYVHGDIGEEQAEEDLAAQSHRIRPLILAESELVGLAAQTIVNSLLDALRKTVNTAAGIALL